MEPGNKLFYHVQKENGAKVWNQFGTMNLLFFIYVYCKTSLELQSSCTHIKKKERGRGKKEGGEKEYTKNYFTRLGLTRFSVDMITVGTSLASVNKCSTNGHVYFLCFASSLAHLKAR